MFVHMLVFFPKKGKHYERGKDERIINSISKNDDDKHKSKFL